MATSGSVKSGTAGSGGKSYFLVEWSRSSYSIPNNTSTISWTLKVVAGNYWYSNAIRIDYVKINGTTVKGSETYSNISNTTKTLASGTLTIPHNSDGTKTFSISLSGWFYDYGTKTGSGSFTLDKIPRYATVTQTLSSKTETSVTMKWTSDSTIDYIWYSSNNGSSWTGINVTDGTSGSYTISGLSANTAYNIKTRVRRKDSQLTTDSSAMSVTTYAYPYANSMPSFTIGERLTLGIYNPLGREVTVNILGADDSQISNDTTTGTSITGYAGDVVVNRLYASIPNAQSGTYKVKVTYGSQITTKTGGTYSINPNDCTPSIGSVAYQDTNSTVTAITQNNQNIVQNHSTVRYSASGLTAQKSATVASCKVTVNGNNYNLTLSGSSASGGNAVINSAQDVEATFTVTDSRGLTGTKTLTIHMLDWQLPTAIITIQRRNNYYSETDITVDANYSYVDGKNTISIAYKAKKQGTSSWTVTGTLQDNVSAMVTIDNTYAWDFQITLTDRFGGTTTYNVSVARGMPIAFFDRIRESVGVNCFPQHDRSLEVNGYDILFHAGESVTITNVNCIGMLTNAGKSLRFTVVLPKPKFGLTVTCTEMKLNVRHPDGGYTLDNAFVSGGYDVLMDNTITVTQLTTGMDNVITFNLAKSTAFNGTNNTPQAVTIESMTLEFS